MICETPLLISVARVIIEISWLLRIVQHTTLANMTPTKCVQDETRAGGPYLTRKGYGIYPIETNLSKEAQRFAGSPDRPETSPGYSHHFTAMTTFPFARPVWT